MASLLASSWSEAWKAGEQPSNVERAPLIFSIDGERQEVKDADPAMTLIDYLRSNGYTSPKLGCGEGGCGACTVTVASWDDAAGVAKYRSVNSCLMALCSCDGLSVTTSYGLGNSQKGFHAIQEALAKHNGSQCGFCSPGMVMSLFGKLSSAKGDKCQDELAIESCIDGNLCRCTGYRPILEAFKTFAGTDKENVAGEKFAPFPEFLKGRSNDTTRQYEIDGKTWISPGTLKDLVCIVKEQNGTGGNFGMVAGHTCKGIYKDEHCTDIHVDVSRVKELQAVKVNKAQSIELGAAVTWGSFIETLEEVSRESGPAVAGLKVLLEHARKVAGHSVRNLGTLGGNLAMTKRRGFQSDLATILAGVGASLTMIKGGIAQTVPVDKFFEPSFGFAPDTVLTGITVPFLKDGELFKTYRTAVRPINSHALTNAAFRVKMTGGKIADAALVFGALGSRGAAPGPSDPETGSGSAGGPIRASGTEAALVGQTPNEETLKAALNALTKEPWFPEDEFERHLSLSYLRKMFHTMEGKADGDDKAPVLGVSQSSERPVTRSEQKVLWNTPEKAPICSPMPKLSSNLQAAGEQQYVADLPEPKHCLHAAYVTIPRAAATFVSADTGKAEASAGFVGIVSADDIKGGNVCELTTSHKMLVPKGSASQYAGQPCLIVLADTTRHAEAAARKVELKLELPKSAPVLSIGQCKELQSQADAGKIPKPDAPYVKDLYKFKRGDAAAAMATAKNKSSGKAFCDGQKAFYMEPPAAIAIPGEGGTLQVWGSFQVLPWVHSMVCGATGLPKNKIVVNATHIGGGFGGKLFKSIHAPIACCIAAQKYGKPVRLVLNRNVDTAMCGGRLSMDIDYEVGFDDAGKILALAVVNHADAGQGDACTGFATAVAGKNMEQTYWLPDVTHEVKACTTHKSGNTAIRGPGEPQSTFIMETILTHVAEKLGVSQQHVREINMFSSLDDREKVAANPTSPDTDKYSPLFASGKCIEGPMSGPLAADFPALGIWMSLKKKIDFDAKEALITKFNAEHKWRKRGLAMTPVKYGVENRHQQCLMQLYDDATCYITIDGTEIGQGLHTKVIQYASYYLSQIVPGSEFPLDKIRVGPNGTDKIAQASITGGSTTSEGVCEAVRDAIGKLTENLKPIKEMIAAANKKLEDDGKAAEVKPLTIGALLAKAGDESHGIELQVSGKNPTKLPYQVYGACCSEVEIDVLTGETVILSSSLLYDCGKSLNPTIDLGQCEGGFMMGIGFFLRERLLQDDTTGKMITDGTWEYKIPCFQDVPLQFDVEFFPRAHDKGVQSSKASGEPPIVLASSVFFAVKDAVLAGRKEFGKESGPFRLDAPCTPRDIALSIGAAAL